MRTEQMIRKQGTRSCNLTTGGVCNLIALVFMQRYNRHSNRQHPRPCLSCYKHQVRQGALVVCQDDRFVAPVERHVRMSKTRLDENENENENENTCLVVLSNLTDEVCEGLVDVDTLLSRRLDEFATEVLGKITTLCTKLYQRAVHDT